MFIELDFATMPTTRGESAINASTADFHGDVVVSNFTLAPNHRSELNV
jgi:hypothetical protein